MNDDWDLLAGVRWDIVVSARCGWWLCWVRKFQHLAAGGEVEREGAVMGRKGRFSR